MAKKNKNFIQKKLAERKAKKEPAASPQDVMVRGIASPRRETDDKNKQHLFKIQNTQLGDSSAVNALKKDIEALNDLKRSLEEYIKIREKSKLVNKLKGAVGAVDRDEKITQAIRFKLELEALLKKFEDGFDKKPGFVLPNALVEVRDFKNKIQDEIRRDAELNKRSQFSMKRNVEGEFAKILNKSKEKLMSIALEVSSKAANLAPAKPAVKTPPKVEFNKNRNTQHPTKAGYRGASDWKAEDIKAAGADSDKPKTFLPGLKGLADVLAEEKKVKSGRPLPPPPSSTKPKL